MAIEKNNQTPNGIVSAYKNLPIAKKVGSGFGVILVILVTINALSYVNFEKTKTDVNQLTALVDEASLIASIEADFLKLRGEIESYVAYGDPATMQAIDALKTKITGHFNRADSVVQTALARETLTALQSDMKQYRIDLDKASDLNKAFRDRLTNSITPVQAELIALIQSQVSSLQRSGSALDLSQAQAVLIDALRAQKLVAEALGLSSQAAAAALPGALNRFVSNLDRFLSTQSSGETMANATAYQASVLAALDERQQISALVDGEMEVLATSIQDRANALEQTALAEEKALKAEINELVALAEAEQVITGVIGVALGLVLAFFIGRSLSKPLEHMTRSMVRLSDGHLDITVPDAQRKDEIGKMASALAVFKENAEERRRLEAEQKEAEKRAEAEKRQLMITMADDFEASVGSVIGNVSKASEDMQQTAGNMSTTAQATNERSMTVSSAAQQAASNVNTVASATEELSSSIGEINQQVSNSTAIAQKAITEVESMSAEMSTLRETAEAINSVVELITEIAEKTNLLSLNATIEAARAGDAGKGFAVVASEVKSLANQTATATDQIAKQIGNVQIATEKAAETMAGIGKTINTINEITGSVAAAVEEQGAATQEIARNVQEAAAGTEEVTRNMEQVATAANDTGAASEDVLTAAGDLSKQSEILKTQMREFLGKLRAA